MIKEVKDRKYVYRQYRLDGRVVTEYIKPLKEIVSIYEFYKRDRVEELNRRLIRYYARQLAQGIENKLVNQKTSEKTEKEKNGDSKEGLVRRPGFEPGITGLGGRRPSPG